MEAGTGQDLWTVSGLIVNDPDGPRRWCGCFEAFDAKMAESMAREQVWAEVREGRHGVLIVANVFAFFVDNADQYAVYGDDPDRPSGYRDAERPWSAPAGFQGLEDRMPFSVLPVMND